NTRHAHRGGSQTGRRERGRTRPARGRAAASVRYRSTPGRRRSGGTERPSLRPRKRNHPTAAGRMRRRLIFLVSHLVRNSELARSSFDDKPIFRSTDPGASTTQFVARQTSTGVDLSRLLIATVLVIVLIFVVRWVAQKWLPSTRA